MIEYIVNKEKRTIVAMIEFDNNEETFKNSKWIYDDLVSALRNLEDCEFSDKKYRAGWDKMTFPRYISAKAKCNPEDEWDEEYGKRVARHRLIEKIRNYRSNSYKIIAGMIDRMKEIVY